MDQSTFVREEQDSPTRPINDFLKHLETFATSEEKLQASVRFMREALAQEGMPNLKGFWEVRKHCLSLFKSHVSGALRSQLWGEYIELTREGRCLKNLIDSETAFAVKQIDLAIFALEEGIKAFNDHLETVLEKSTPVDFPTLPKELQKRFPFYEKLQKQLSLLNMYASQINALRKELIKTEMRIRQKNKFFQRLSSLGDTVFPVRKMNIREISESFIEDVAIFVAAAGNLSSERMRRSVFFFRGEIKTLQAFSKILTLNTYAFSTTRDQLSQFWDELKVLEKERKKEYLKQKQKSTENSQKVHEHIEAFKRAYSLNELSLEEGIEELKSISRSMRELELTREDIRSLREALKIAHQPLTEKQEEQKEAQRQKEIALEKTRQEKIEQFTESIEAIKENMSSSKVEVLFQELEVCRKTLSLLTVTKPEKQLLDQTLNALRDQISEKQEKRLLALPDGDRAVLENLKNILVERKKRRKEIKTQIEDYRKIIGGSGLDFEKAMRYNELMRAEKESLAKVDKGISEIEQKISELKGKV